jgi:hypothetical protein
MSSDEEDEIMGQHHPPAPTIQAPTVQASAALQASAATAQAQASAPTAQAQASAALQAHALQAHALQAHALQAHALQAQASAAAQASTVGVHAAPPDVASVLYANKMADLKRFLKKRQCLNTTNGYFTYLFHFLQMGGLLTTAVAQSYGFNTFVWVGIGINSLATLVHVYEQTNTKISNHLLGDIVKIKHGAYVDEATWGDLDHARPESDQKKAESHSHV